MKIYRPQCTAGQSMQIRYSISLSSYFIPGDNKTVSKIIKENLYKTYLQFCEDNNVPKHKRKDSVKAFTIALQHHGFFPRRRTIDKIEREVYEVTKWRLNPNKQILKEDKSGTDYKLIICRLLRLLFSIFMAREIEKTQYTHNLLTKSGRTGRI